MREEVRKPLRFLPGQVHGYPAGRNRRLVLRDAFGIWVHPVGRLLPLG